MNELLICLGKAGSGKSFTAKIISEQLGHYFYDANQDLTRDMINAMRTGKKFTKEMRDRYFSIVINKFIYALGYHHFFHIRKKLISHISFI